MGGGNGKRHKQGMNRSLDKKRRRDNEDNWKNTRGDDQRTAAFTTEVFTNSRFVAFYRAQGFISDSEWDDFMKSLGTTLPACFRINADYAFASELKNQLQHFAGNTVKVGTVEIPAVLQMPWYPSAYKLGTDRKTIRKVPELAGLHQWLIQHTDCGNITRQEAVSMIPPLALNVSPHHKCLDMCAAPGSKTSQLLEIVNRSLGSPEEEQGLVVANDSDTDRAYMLVHQCRRINSPLLVVTTHKGQMFPKIDYRDEDNNKDGYFDRVLCDVPCSGDGTLRKNPAIWTKWSTSSALSLHPLQMIIAQRGVQLLKTGGLMVYSTCSMSPLEDEAVIAELLRHFKGQLELVDPREFVPVFKARPGLSSWHVLDDAKAIRKQASAKKFSTKKARYEARMGIEPVVEVKEGEEGADATASSEAPAVKAEVKYVQPQNASAIVEDDSEPAGMVVGDTPEEAEGRAEYVQVMPEDPLLAECVNMGMAYYPDYESVPDFLRRKIRKSHFPPTEEEKSWMHLERCMRCVPHDEDTGGFFVATLRKVAKPASDIPTKGTTSATAEKEDTVDEGVLNEEDAAAAEAAATTETSDVLIDGSAKMNDVPNYNKGLIDFQMFSSAHYEKIKSYYGFTSALSPESMVVREDFMAARGSAYNSAKSVYYLPRSLRDFMGRDKEQNLKVVTAGIKVLERMANKGKGAKIEDDYRLVQDGLSSIVPHITTRKVSVSVQDFCNLLGGGLVSLSTLHPDTLVALAGLSSGAVICEYKYRKADVLKVLPGTTEGEEVAGVKEEEEDEQYDAPVIFAELPTKSKEADVKNEVVATDPDVMQVEHVQDVESAVEEEDESGHRFYAMCWRGLTRTMNVMCGKTEIVSMKHQLSALGVLRPKIAAIRREFPDASGEGEAAVAEVAGVKTEVNDEKLEKVEHAADGDAVVAVTEA